MQKCALKEITSNETYKDDVLDSFRLIDINGTGLLSCIEVKIVLSWFGILIKDWPTKQVYNENDFLHLSQAYFPKLIKDRSITLLAAAYRRRYFLKVAESQLLQPIPTWPKHLPVINNAKSGLSAHDMSGDKYLLTQRIDSGLLCPPRIHRPHWLAFRKWLVLYQTFHYESTDEFLGSIDATLIPKAIQASLARSKTLAGPRKKWISSLARSPSAPNRSFIAALKSPSEIEEDLSRRRETRDANLRQWMRDCEVTDEREVLIMSPLGRRSVSRRRIALTPSKHMFLSKGARLPMLHLT